MNNSIDQFREAMLNAGLAPPAIITPGMLHRFPGKGKGKDNKAGWYVLFDDLKGGVFGDYSTGLYTKWKAEGWEKLSFEEQEAFYQRCESERRQRDIEQQQRHKETAMKAKEILNAATGDVNTHPYAAFKRVFLGLRVKRGAWPQCGWHDALLVPLYDRDQKLWTIEAINTEGDKNFLKGGRKKGCFYPFGTISGADRVLIGEGLATVAAVYAATSTPAVAAMGAGSLLYVALAIRELAPRAQIILLADNDIKSDGSNIGVKAATEAAKAVSGIVAIPELNNEECDFWDLWDKKGEEVVRDVLSKATKVAEVARIAAPGADECEPEPLRATLSPAEPYPVDELGPILSRAAMVLHKDIKAPLAMCAQSVLAVASYAVQAHFDVQLPWGEQKPCTLFFLTVGESGSRKSSVDNTVLIGIKAKQKNDQKQYMEDLEAYKAQDSAWQKAVEQSRRKAVGPKEFVTADSILKADSLCGEKPKPPIMPIRLISDPTIEGLYKLLEKNQPNVALFSDEAGLLIGGHALNSDNALKTMTRWSKMWDGASFDRVRSADGSGVLYGRRMAMHQLAQPEVMTMLLSNRMANEQGLLARCLVAWPDSLIGSRIDDEYRIVSDRSEVKDYIEEINNLISVPPKTTENPQELDPTPLPLSSAAVTLALESGKRFERLMAKGQDLAELTDRGGKAVENACRIACVLAVIDGGLNTKEISAEHMTQALCIIQWYLNEALRIRSVSAISQSTIDAELLSAWLKERSIKAFRSTQILNGGPRSLRDKARFSKAVSELVKCGYLVENEANTEIDGVRARLSWRVLHYVV
jgi:putative DNA primase/helicase